MDEHTQARLAGQRVVYLETGFTELAKRVGLDRAAAAADRHEPARAAQGAAGAAAADLRRLAWLTVQTDGREPDEIAAEIAAVIEVTRPGGAVATAGDRDPDRGRRRAAV